MWLPLHAGLHTMLWLLMASQLHSPLPGLALHPATTPSCIAVETGCFLSVCWLWWVCVGLAGWTDGYLVLIVVSQCVWPDSTSHSWLPPQTVLVSLSTHHWNPQQKRVSRDATLSRANFDVTEAAQSSVTFSTPHFWPVYKDFVRGLCDLSNKPWKRYWNKSIYMMIYNHVCCSSFIVYS